MNSQEILENLQAQLPPKVSWAAFFDQHRDEVASLIGERGMPITADLLGVNRSTLQSWLYKRGISHPYPLRKKREPRLQKPAKLATSESPERLIPSPAHERCWECYAAGMIKALELLGRP